jgi:hypothetical protein
MVGINCLSSSLLCHRNPKLRGCFLVGFSQPLTSHSNLIRNRKPRLLYTIHLIYLELPNVERREDDGAHT